MFSVVIPAYNCENTIVATIDSVLRQTRIDLIEEIIVVNDGSEDQTEKIVNDYMLGCERKYQYINFVLISHPNKGVSYTRNRGILISKAEWIALLDSDDIWVENKLERQFYFKF